MFIYLLIWLVTWELFIWFILLLGCLCICCFVCCYVVVCYWVFGFWTYCWVALDTCLWVWLTWYACLTYRLVICMMIYYFVGAWLLINVILLGLLVFRFHYLFVLSVCFVLIVSFARFWFYWLLCGWCRCGTLVWDWWFGWIWIWLSCWVVYCGAFVCGCVWLLLVGCLFYLWFGCWLTWNCVRLYAYVWLVVDLLRILRWSVYCVCCYAVFESVFAVLIGLINSVD